MTDLYPLYILPLIIWLAVAMVVGISKSRTKSRGAVVIFMAIITGWFLILFAFGAQEKIGGFLKEALAFGPIAIGLAVLFLIKRLRVIISNIPIFWLIIPQVGTAAGGALLFRAATDHDIPTYFGISLGLGDLIVGLAAPFVAYAAARIFNGWERAVFIFAAFGILELLNGVAAGVIAFATNEAAGDFLEEFPWILIMTFVIPASFLLHCFTLFKLKHLSKADIQS